MLGTAARLLALLSLASAAPLADSARGEDGLRYVTRRMVEVGHLLDRAVAPTITACMERGGFTYRYLEPHESPDAGMGDFGITDRGRAAQFGYGAAPDTHREPTEQDYGVPTDPAAQAQWYAAFVGDQTERIEVKATDGRMIADFRVGTGCRSKGYIQVFGSSDAYVEYLKLIMVLQDLANQQSLKVLTQSDFIELSNEWLTCMTDHGFALAGVRTPEDALGFDFPLPRPSPGELRAAVADVDCKEQTKFLSRVEPIVARVDAEGTAAAAELLSQFRAVEDRIRAAAQA